jgi:hypothetical protein
MIMDLCTKVRYANKACAKEQINKLKQKGGYKKASSYSCCSCGGYHITQATGHDKKVIRENQQKFSVGQVWRDIKSNKEKFIVVSTPCNGEGLSFILNNFYLSEG